MLISSDGLESGEAVADDFEDAVGGGDEADARLLQGLDQRDLALLRRPRPELGAALGNLHDVFVELGERPSSSSICTLMRLRYSSHLAGVSQGRGSWRRTGPAASSAPRRIARRPRRRRDCGRFFSAPRTWFNVV